MNELQDILGELGLRGKKATVYLASLELGSASVQEISRGANVKRPTAFGILEALERQGFIRSSVKGRTRLFVAEAPQKLVEILLEKERRLASVLPDLEALRERSSPRPWVRFFEGDGVFRRLLDDALAFSKTKKIFAVLPDATLSFFSDSVWKEFTRQRVRERIHLFLLLPSSCARLHFFPSDLQEIRCLSRDAPHFLSWFCYDQKVAIGDADKESFGAIIHSENFFRTQRYFFDLLWKAASPFPF